MPNYFDAYTHHIDTYMHQRRPDFFKLYLFWDIYAHY